MLIIWSITYFDHILHWTNLSPDGWFVFKVSKYNLFFDLAVQDTACIKIKLSLMGITVSDSVLAFVAFTACSICFFIPLPNIRRASQSNCRFAFRKFPSPHFSQRDSLFRCGVRVRWE